MSITTKDFEELLINTNSIIGLDGLRIPSEIEVDENDVNLAFELIEKDLVGKGNNYNEELKMSMYFNKLRNMTSSKYLEEIFASYENFLSIDSIAKYILARVRKSRVVNNYVLAYYCDSLKEINKYVRKNTPLKVLDECLDEYLRNCYQMLLLVEMGNLCCE